MTEGTHAAGPHDLTELIERVRASDRSSFYRDHWENEREFSRLPEISRNEFIRVPLSERRYKNEKGLVKIVRDEQGTFLTEWSFDDIRKESYGTRSKRPMVYMSEPHEAIEKAMWCYESGMLPLIGEKDADIASLAAGKYRIDSLITDARALPKLDPYLKSRTETLECISILGPGSSIDELRPYRECAEHVRLVLSLPETGAFAQAELSDDVPVFEALPGCIIERTDPLVVTKVRMLVTPVIRFRTEIARAAYDGA